jgi:hypothetical protein
MVKKGYEGQQGWFKIPVKKSVWTAVKIGDEIEGKYLKRESTLFRGRPNYKYWLESNHPLNDGGKVTVDGTDHLNNLMEDVPIGHKVKIVYKGERRSADPQKTAFKLFDVHSSIVKTEQLNKKFIINDNTKNGPTLAFGEDLEAKNIIEHYKLLLEDQYQPITDGSIIKMAETDPDITSKNLMRVKIQLVEMVKSKEIKSGSGGR